MKFLIRLIDAVRWRLFPPPPPPLREIVCNVASCTGWTLIITRQLGAYGADLIDPIGRRIYSIRFWPSFDATLESTCGYLARVKGLPRVATALRASAEAEAVP